VPRGGQRLHFRGKNIQDLLDEILQAADDVGQSQEEELAFAQT